MKIKMKALAIFLFPIAAIAQPETFYVTFLKGVVINKQTRQPLRVGDKLASADNLIFRDPQAKVSVVSPGKGRFELDAQKLKPSVTGELLAIVKSSLLPVTSTYHLSTRSVVFQGYDPKSYFSAAETGGRVLLFTDRPLPINSSYTLDADHFFFIQFSSNGRTVTKKIPASNNGLQFIPALFMDEAGRQVTDPVMICYQSPLGGKSNSTQLSSFIPVLADWQTLKEQVVLIKKYSNTTNEKKLQQEISAHVFSNYGKIGAEELDQLMQ